jgi:flagellar basal body-associated protein FliL
MKKIILWSVIAVLVLATGTYFAYGYIKNKAISFVTISINPEVQLALNSDEKVVDVLALNEDADVLLTGVELIGLTVDEASNKIVDEAINLGYIDEYSGTNEITVSVSNGDEDGEDELEEELTDNISTHLEDEEVYALVLNKEMSEEIKADADTYNVSNGKMLLVSTAISLDSTLEKATLADMSVQDIQRIIRKNVELRYEQLGKESDDYEDEWAAEKENLELETQNGIEELKEDLTSEVANFNSLSEQEKQAKTNELLKTKKQEAKTVYEQNKEKNNQGKSNKNK